MATERISPSDAKALLAEGHLLLDVRSVEEYEAEHAQGAVNIPYLKKGPYGMIPNEEFVVAIRGFAPDLGAPIVTMCSMGARSLRAAAELSRLGYQRVRDLRGGLFGENADDGTVAAPGWKSLGLPMASGRDAGAYGHVRYKLGLEKPVPTAPPAAPKAPAPHAPGPKGARFAHPTQTVRCRKLGRELPALRRAPMGGALGERIKLEISAEAWEGWVEQSKLLINEYRLNPADPRAQAMLLEQCEAYLFGGGIEAPKEYVPKHGH